MNQHRDTDTIKVLYYPHKHTPSSVPQRGTLTLSSTHLTYESHATAGPHKQHIQLQLIKIRSVQPYKGRLHPGIQFTYDGADRENNNFIFTKVSSEWYEKISNAIDAARVKHELEVTVKPRLKGRCSPDSRDMLVCDEENERTRTCLTIVLLPFSTLFSVVIKLILLTSKKITGHNYLLPNTIEDAIRNVEVALPSIVKRSEENQTTKAIQVAIREEVKYIYQSLERIKSFARRVERRADSSAGNVEDRKEEATLSKIHPVEIISSFRALITHLIDLIFFIIWKLNIPLLKREQFILRKQPATVAEAVRNASCKVDDLVELANEKYAFKALIADEIDSIRERLFNVKVLSLTVDIPSSLVEG